MMGYLGIPYQKGKESVYLVPAMSLGLSTIAGDQKAQQIPFEDRNKETREQIGGNNDFIPLGWRDAFNLKEALSFVVVVFKNLGTQMQPCPRGQRGAR